MRGGLRGAVLHSWPSHKFSYYIDTTWNIPANGVALRPVPVSAAPLSAVFLLLIFVVQLLPLLPVPVPGLLDRQVGQSQ
jgi:hypothetical protein